MSHPDECPASQTIFPMLAIRGAADAMAWYQRAFGAKEVMRLTAPDGSVVHGELSIGGAIFSLAEENPQFNLSPASVGGTTVILDLTVADAEASFARAVEAGAEVVFPVADQFYGYRSGRLRDPFGHLWLLNQKLEDLSSDEMQRRFDDMCRGK